MPQLLLSEFVDIVSTSGLPKATKVRQAKHRPPYNPAADYYKKIREDIVFAHQSARGKNFIDNTLSDLVDKKKVSNYTDIVAGYKKWWGNRSPVWFDPPDLTYSDQNIDVLVNPELGLNINGTSYLIKLYFKADPLAKNRVAIVTHLMAICSSQSLSLPPNTVMSVLDVRRSKLITPSVPLAGLTSILNAEMAYIANLWPTI